MSRTPEPSAEQMALLAGIASSDGNPLLYRTDVLALSALLAHYAELKRDSERLDWLDAQGDIGVIHIDPDLVGSLTVGWNKFQSWDPDLIKVAPNVRAAIDAVKEQGK